MTVTSQPPDLQTVLSVLQGVVPRGPNYMALCPTHKDLSPSLSIATGSTQPVVVKCFAGCEQEIVWAEIKARIAANSNGHAPSYAPSTPKPTRKLVAVYPYTDEQGKLLYSVHRFEPKDFRQENANGEPTTRGVRRVPFHLPQLIEGIKNTKAIYIVEGEKDVLNLEAQGIVATCNAGGAGKWLPEFRQFFSQAYVVVVADWDEPGKKHALQVYENLCVVAKSVEIKRAASGGKDISDHLVVQGNTVANLIPINPSELGYVPRETNGVITLSDVTATEVEWLWQDRIPMGMMSIQDGNQDEGKSLVLTDLAARVSRDGVMPDGGAGRAGHVMLLAAEDHLTATIKQRIEAAEAVQERIHFLQEASIPSGIERLEEIVTELNIKLMILDPLMAYLDEDVKIISEPSARKALKPLGDMAERTGCAIVFNRHFNKDSTSGKTAAMRGSGSVAIGAQCRAAWAIGSFPNQPDAKFMAPTKSNLSKKPPTLKFHIALGANGYPRIEWDGNSEIHADQLVGADWTHEDKTDKELQRQWLIDELANIKFIDSKSLIEKADQHGISESVLKKLKLELHVKSVQRDGRWLVLGAQADSNKIVVLPPQSSDS